MERFSGVISSLDLAAGLSVATRKSLGPLKRAGAVQKGSHAEGGGCTRTRLGLKKG